MKAAPIRFLVVVVGGWISARAAILSGGNFAAVGVGAGTGTMIALTGLAVAPIPARSIYPVLPPPAAAVTVALDAPWRGASGPAVEIALDEAALHSGQGLPMDGDDPLFVLVSFAKAPPPVGQPPAWMAPARPPDHPASRWSTSAWLFARSGDGPSGLATGGQLGGGQAGTRLAYRLNFDGPVTAALVARLSSPLHDQRGAEAAVGFDLHPSPGRSLRLSIERRIALGAHGRNAWSAYAAGGFYMGGLPGGLIADGYAQAGVVGFRAGDLFADGALRVSRPISVGGRNTVSLGAGLWGAAQPRVARLGLGPRAALTMPVDRTVLTMALDWRIKVAGDARPGSGVAFTLASDF